MKNTITRQAFLLLILFVAGVSRLNAQHCIWGKSAKGAGGAINSFGRAVATDAAGNVFVAGDFTADTLSFGTTSITNRGTLTSDAFVAKYDSSGNFLWVRNFGGRWDDFGYSVATDISGNVYVAGNFGDTLTFGTTTFVSNTSTDAFLVKFNNSGTVLWAKSGKGVTGSNNMQSIGVATGLNKNVIVTGYFDSSITFGSVHLAHAYGGIGTYVVKYDSAGNILWGRNSNDYSGQSHPYGLSLDAAGDIYVAGDYVGDSLWFGSIVLNGDSYNDGYLVKYSSAGTPLWARRFTSTNDAACTAIAADAAGYVYTAGYYSGTMLIGSTTLSYADTTFSDLFITRYDASGNPLWAKRAYGIYDDMPTSLVCDAGGNAIISGVCSSLGITFGTLTLSNAGMFLVKYTSSGSVAWAKGASDSISSFFVTSMAMDSHNDLYATGDYNSATATLDAVTLTDANSPMTNVFVAKFRNLPTGIENLNNANNTTLVYPNPVDNILNIVAENPINDILITNLLGQTVYTGTFNTNRAVIDVAAFTPGIYLLRVNGTAMQRFVRE